MEELERGTIFRLATLKDTFPPDSEKLQVSHFELSENDKRRAEETGSPPLLSVFEGARTTVAQALVIRGVQAESAAFGLQVEDVRQIQVAGLDRRLRVLRDPLDPPLSELPGADGHCGIEGLDRRHAEEKRLYRELRVHLADRSFRYRDEMSEP
jgi:hypothetical protein